MKNGFYEKVNFHAENDASAVYESIGEDYPCIFSLRKWVEENFSLKIEIVFEKMGTRISGLVHPGASSDKYKLLINSNDSECRQRFTVCHEIGHIIRDRELLYGFSSGDIDSKKKEERYCNRFSAAFLMPRELFIKKWQTMGGEVLYKQMIAARFFKVSVDAVYYRANELGLL